MRLATRNSAQTGFTLVELVIVMVLLGIVAIFSFRFVGIGADMYGRGVERLQILDKTRFAVERVTREVRNSVPNSVRTLEAAGQQCLEFVPMLLAGTYYDAPFKGSDDAELTLVSLTDRNVTLLNDTNELTGSANPNYHRLLIYPTQASYIYSDELPPRRWNLLQDDVTWNAGSNENLLTLEPGSRYKKKSPRQRLFVGAAPVSYCVNAQQQLIRYSNYGWNTTQTVPSAVTGKLMTTNLINLTSAGSQLPFAVEQASLLRNNVVHVFFEYRTADNESLYFNQEIQIPNVP